MITETGRVVAVEPDSLWVETIRQNTCGSCVAQKGCGHGLMNKLTSRNHQAHHVRALVDPTDSQGYSLNDEVEIAVAEHVLVKAALFVYLAPLLALLAGAITASQLGLSDGFVALGAFFGFVFGLFIVRLHAWLTRNDVSQQPRVVGLTRSTIMPPTMEETLAIK